MSEDDQDGSGGSPKGRRHKKTTKRSSRSTGESAQHNVIIYSLSETTIYRNAVNFSENPSEVEKMDFDKLGLDNENET